MSEIMGTLEAIDKTLAPEDVENKKSFRYGEQADSAQWQALELIDNFVRDQMAECDSLNRVLSHMTQ